MLGASLVAGKPYSLSLIVKLDRLRHMESALDYHTARALLEWQIELGVTETIGDAPVDRYALPDTAPKAEKATGRRTRAGEKPRQRPTRSRWRSGRRKAPGRWLSCVRSWTRLICAT